MSKVAVIIATRNRCSLLPRAVESARSAGVDVEIVVVDDASSDQTGQVCKRWPDVRYHRAKRQLGPGGVRNVGLLLTKAPYITFLDDDDARLEGSLDAQIDVLERHPEAGFIYGKVLYGDEETRPKGGFYPEHCPEGDLFWELLKSNFVPCPTVVFRRECLKRVGLLDEDAPGVEDWDLWVRIAELYPVVAIDQTVAIWRQGRPGSNQFTSHAERLHHEANRLHREKWLRLPRVASSDRSRRRKVARAFAARASQQLVWTAVDQWREGQRWPAARVALTGTRMYPLGTSKCLLSLFGFRSSMRSVEH